MCWRARLRNVLTSVRKGFLLLIAASPWSRLNSRSIRMRTRRNYAAGFSPTRHAERRLRLELGCDFCKIGAFARCRTTSYTFAAPGYTRIRIAPPTFGGTICIRQDCRRHHEMNTAPTGLAHLFRQLRVGEFSSALCVPSNFRRLHCCRVANRRTAGDREPALVRCDFRHLRVRFETGR